MDTPAGAASKARITVTARIDSAFEVACPDCGAAMRCVDVHFVGMPIFAECACPECGAVFMVDWPAGHALLHPTMLRAATGEAFIAGREWYPRALQRLFASRANPIAPAITVHRRESSKRTALIVNCVDFVYGHCLLKLLSASPFLSDVDVDVDVLVIAPKNITWLVPTDVPVLIELDLDLSDAGRWVDGLDAAVKDVLGEYEIVKIAPTPSQPRLTSAELSAALPATRHEFWNADNDELQLTLLLREDRLWLGGSKLLDRVRPARFIPSRVRRRLAIELQMRRFAAVARQVRAVLPETRVVTIGQGRTGRLPADVIDLRRAEITAEDERQWLAEYERTTVLVGVHGTHMLVPSALAGAVINLLPETKLPNVTQDLLIPADTDEDPKLLLFRYRVIPERSAPDTVSALVVSLLSDRRFHYRNVVENRSADGRDWPRGLSWRPLDPAEPPTAPC
jgi:hypothetical protein